MESLYDEVRQAWDPEQCRQRHTLQLSPRVMLLLYAWKSGPRREVIETADLFSQVRRHLGAFAVVIKSTQGRTEVLRRLLSALPEAEPVRFALDRHQLFALAVAAQEAQHRRAGPYEELGPLLSTIERLLPPALKDLLAMASFSGSLLPVTSDRVLLWSDEHRAYWGPDRSGYTSDMMQAGVYGLEEAQALVRGKPDKQIRVIPALEAARELTARRDLLVRRMDEQLAQLLGGPSAPSLSPGASSTPHGRSV